MGVAVAVGVGVGVAVAMGVAVGVGVAVGDGAGAVIDHASTACEELEPLLAITMNGASAPRRGKRPLRALTGRMVDSGGGRCVALERGAQPLVVPAPAALEERADERFERGQRARGAGHRREVHPRATGDALDEPQRGQADRAVARGRS